MTLLARVRQSAFWPMVWKEFVQMRRDRLTLGIMVGIPALQLVLYGYAIQTEVRHLPTVVLDEARTADSRALVQAILNTGNFDLHGAVASRAEVARHIGAGTARAAIVIPPDFSVQLRRGHPATAQVIVDAADPLASSAAIAAATQAGAAHAQAVAGTRAPPLPIDVRVRPWYNPTLRSAVYIVPGLVGVLLSLTMVIITAMAVVREREVGTLEQLIVTPITRTSLIVGKLAPFVLVGLVQTTVVLVLGAVLFGVPVRGSVALLYGVTVIFIVASLALGLLFSTMVRTQGQAQQMGMMYLLPNILLSGFMFPREAMPPLAQWVGALLPLTYFLQVLRGILLKDVGLAALWPQVLALAGFAVVLVSLTVTRFRKTLE